MMNRLATDELAELISSKHEVLEHLRRLARQQGDLITAGEHVKLMSVLAAKDNLLRQLLDLERRLDPFRREEPDGRTWRTASARWQCQQVAERCDSLLRELMLLEKQGERDLCRRRDDAARQLEGMHSASEAWRAYGDCGRMATNRSQLDCES